MRLASWNVNSLRVRLDHLLDWLANVQPDVACLQETKTEDANFPVAELRNAGYHAAFCGQRAYNGVAILSRSEIQDVAHGIPGFADQLKRCIAATVDGVRVVCLYAPNGEAPGTDKYAYKLRWYEALTGWMTQALQHTPNLALLGDMNVAPEDRDVHDPKRWAGKIHVSEPEREALRRLMAVGFADAFRLFSQPERVFSWWDYRLNAFQRGWGLRIDLALLAPAVAKRCTACTIDLAPRRRERPSDHAPVIVDLN
ncbi:MAG TPA: exodeoxyribonuclease III [Burkholderiales bacterium]